MKILLVDDDVDVMDGIIAGIDLAALGFSQVFTAVAADEARELLQREKIDVMVTDIEMPGQSGLELLEWVRDNDMNTVTLFCTCYADFNYSRKAFELHCFDYFLKPIEYSKLEERLRQAAKEVHKRVSTSAQELDAARKTYWDRLLTGGVRSNRLEPVLGYGSGDRFTAAVIHQFFDDPALSSWQIYAFQNVVFDLLSSAEGVDLLELLSPEETVQYAIICQTGAEPSFETVYEQIAASAHEILGLNSAAYFWPDCSLETVLDCFRRTRDAFYSDVLTENTAVDVRNYQPVAVDYRPLDTAYLQMLLSTGKREKVFWILCDTLDREAQRRNLNGDYLRAMRTDVFHLLHADLTGRGLDTRVLINDENYERFRVLAAYSLPNMKMFLRYLLERMNESDNYLIRENTLVRRVKEYIRQNLGGDLNRAEIAQAFYLNADYLARAFKDNCGVSLHSYILEKRMREAERLLLETNKPVSAIAQEVGYDNFSYFSQIFRKKTGISPNEYRKTSAKS